MKKSIPTSKKLAMCNILQTRAQAGKSTNMKFKDKEVDLKKLRRAMKEHTRQQITMRPESLDEWHSADLRLQQFWHRPLAMLVLQLLRLPTLHLLTPHLLRRPWL
jgi:hypothetical protein